MPDHRSLTSNVFKISYNNTNSKTNIYERNYAVFLIKIYLKPGFLSEKLKL